MNPAKRNGIAGGDSISEDRAGKPVISANSTAGNPTPAETRVRDVLNGLRDPSELPTLLNDLWRDGFRCGNQAAQVRVDRAERAADVYYDLAFNGDAARKRHAELLKQFDVMQSRKRSAVRA